ncbi:hypothetical protein BKP45_15035 [Anaerobacillus alkalidiazotrophicus]|uniref:Dihydrofolate reductase n=1 Tax=Anaerobacillus alkalidiazotrophicus TaxID=472963 RepID=A0A1S2M327_9BACI|nr:dihydrofolate reductase [Anaerobacillus alkalidiazotrophicus]OIJ18843.1 hypothetical protein BKP45_15035 [Anaerobacillus alkalidiazotrophicus]
MISLIVAIGENRVIGFENKMPWHLPADLAYFKKVTTGHTVIMGRKTFQSIGKPLPNRTNVILTRDIHFSAADCLVIHSVEEALEIGKDQDIFVIGGAEVYKQFLPFVDRAYITKIHESFSGDTFFPELGENWQLTSSEIHDPDEKNRYIYEFQVFDKVRE